jgi:hypothetical protein
MDADTELADRIASYDWFHTIDLGDGLVTEGHCAADIPRAKAEHIRFTPTPIPRKWTLLDWIKRNPEITPRGVFHASR